MPTRLRSAAYLNHWCLATPVRVGLCGSIACFTVDAAVIRLTAGRRDDCNLARAELKAGLKVERSKGITFQLVTGPDDPD